MCFERIRDVQLYLPSIMYWSDLFSNCYYSSTKYFLRSNLKRKINLLYLTSQLRSMQSKSMCQRWPVYGNGKFIHMFLPADLYWSDLFSNSNPRTFKYFSNIFKTVWFEIFYFFYKWLDPCLPNPCLNNGQCVSSGFGGFSCICQNGFSGMRCENSLPCASNPCQNGGACVSTGYGYRCDCPTGYVGFNCETSKNKSKANLYKDDYLMHLCLTLTWIIKMSRWNHLFKSLKTKKIIFRTLRMFFKILKSMV